MQRAQPVLFAHHMLAYTPLYYLNNIVWELLGKGTGYIDQIAYSIYYAGLGTVV